MQSPSRLPDNVNRPRLSPVLRRTDVQIGWWMVTIDASPDKPWTYDNVLPRKSNQRQSDKIILSVVCDGM